MKTKRLHTALLLSAMACAMAAPMAVGAASSATYESHTEAGAGTCNVNAAIGSNFSVTIPKTITLDGASKTGSYTVTATGDIAGNQQVTVAPDANFQMKNNGGTGSKSVTATVSQDKAAFSSSDLTAEGGASANGTVAAPDLTAGSWASSFNFNIGLSE